MTEQMTEQMAIEHIGNLAGDYKCWDDKISREESLILCKLLDELEQYRALGTVEELRVARDKQIEKKPKRHPGNEKLNYCPSCGLYYGGLRGFEYCSDCGQKLNWKEV